MSLRSVAVVLAFSLVCLPVFGTLQHPASITAEAEGPSGRIVGFTVTVVGGNDGEDGRPADTVVCSPATLSLFPLGTTTVSCTGSEGSTGSFPVNVVDTTAPALTLPRDFNVVTTSSSGQAVTYSATANDIVDGSVAVSCTPPSGSTFALGTTTVSCSASDSRGNTATGQFNITLTTIPGTNPADIIAEATGPDGARVTFVAGTDDDENGRPGGGGCSPASGALFPLGATTVTCASVSFTVTVVDTTGPALTLPADITAVATGPSGADVTYTASANDLVDGEVAIACTPASGSTFALGTTTVNCSASDSRSNSSSGSFHVIVVAEPPPPTDPHDIIAEATSAAGAVVTFNLGFDEGGRPITCTPSSGSTFPLGATTVLCTGNISFIVTVVDTTAPVLTLPSETTLPATSAAGAVGTYSAVANDLVDGSVPVTCAPPSGSTFPLGTTTVVCSASDSRENEASGSFVIHVLDLDPPTIVSLTASPSSIWPPNQQMVNVTVTANVIDNVDATPTVAIYDITCNEAIAPGDVVITGPLTAQLRAARDANSTGRVYTLHIEAIDDAGNRSIGTVLVTVAHDQSSRRRAVR
jgi:hypothetical protein